MLRNKENPYVGPNGPLVQSELLAWVTLMVRNVVDIGQILTKPVPFASLGQALSIGTGLGKI